MKNKEQLVIINLNKPRNLSLEDLIKPDVERLIQVRKDDGGYRIPSPSGKALRKYIPVLYYLIHILLERQYSKNTTERCLYARDYVKMYSRDIEPLKSKNDFRYMWSILFQFKIISCYDVTEPTKYRKSAKGYYFRFTDAYRDSAIVQHEVLVKASIADKLDKKSKAKKYEAKVSPDINNLTANTASYYQYRGLLNLSFDSQSAIMHVEKLFEEKALDVEQYNACMISINNIINKRFSFSHSNVCQRIYTSVTMMPKELRQFIKDSNGNCLTELDFGSFNAFLVYKILNECSPEYKNNVEKIAFENELDLYRRLLSGGDFYRDFKEVFFPAEELNRDQVKDIVLKYWFNGKLNSRNKYRQHMLKRLPKISAIIDSLKQVSYENFSNFTMSRESQLVNEIIYMKFIAGHPDAIIYTIFDSFLIEQKFASELQTMMQEEGNWYFNLNCVVRGKKKN